MPDVTLVTCEPLPEPDPDAAPLEMALETAGMSWRWAVWNDAGADWAASPLTVLRSTWDYYRDHAAFVAWTERVSGSTSLLNPAPLVRWNSHKGYLLELAERGLRVLPTALARRGGEHDLRDLCRARSWREVVIKPAVSAGSWNTYVFESPRAAEGTFSRLVAERDVLVQPFMETVRTHGERSLVVVDGSLTHAVRKHPRFAGEDERVEGPMAVDDDERRLAEAAMNVAQDLAGVDEALLYARVDVVRAADGAPMIAELELIEPSLFFALQPSSVSRFVAGLRRRLSSQ